MIEMPPEVLKGYWCPTCGRFELVRQTWHVRAGSISDRCDPGEMVPLLYERARGRELERLGEMTT